MLTMATDHVPNWRDAFAPRLFTRAAGLVSNGGVGASFTTDGPVELVLSILLGAFFGILAGFMVGTVVRTCSIPLGQLFTVQRLIVAGSVAGAILFGFLSLTDDEE